MPTWLRTLGYWLPGNIVLTDCDFTIQKAIGLQYMWLGEAASGKKLLSKFEVDIPHRLSRVRIYVERVIGMVRQKYTYDTSI